MFHDDERPKPKATITVGDDLAALSVADLAERVRALHAEILRIEAEIEKKQSVTAAAAAFFKQ